MTADTIQEMQTTASNRFNILKDEAAKLVERQEYIADELLQLQGEYRAYEAMLTAFMATPVGDLLPPLAPNTTEARKIEVTEAPADEPTTE